MSDLALPAPRRLGLLARFAARRMAVAGAIIVALVVAMAALAPWIAPQDPNAIDLGNRLRDPVWAAAGSWQHPLGTDAIGRDYLSRLILGARASLAVAFGTVAISGLIGCVLGVFGGFFGGRIDAAVGYVLTCRLAMPGALLVLSAVALLGPSLPNLILVLGAIAWPPFAVVTRTAVMQIRHLDFVAAAVASGSTIPDILRREILPNVASKIVIVATLEFAAIVLAESSLSFLGLGVQPPTAAWGLMASEGKQFMHAKPFLIVLPGLCILALVIAINQVGEGLRAATAPRNSR